MSWHHLERSKRNILIPLFSEHKASCLVNTILEGHAGEAVVDDMNAPSIAMLAYADVVIFGGDARHPQAIKLAQQLPEERAVLPCSDEWHRLLAEVFGHLLVPIERFSFTDERLDTDHLNQLALRVPEGYEIQAIDLAMAHLIVADPSLISPDHVRNFDTPEDFVQRGFGFCALHNGSIVAGVSTYAACSTGIEIQVNTQESYRGHGLATALSARLILQARERGLAAPWDAANEASAKLAKKLGYTSAGTWTAWVRIPSGN